MNSPQEDWLLFFDSTLLLSILLFTKKNILIILPICSLSRAIFWTKNSTDFSLTLSFIGIAVVHKWRPTPRDLNASRTAASGDPRRPFGPPFFVLHASARWLHASLRSARSTRPKLNHSNCPGQLPQRPPSLWHQARRPPRPHVHHRQDRHRQVHADCQPRPPGPRARGGLCAARPPRR